jgi:hypothetical protein
MSLVRTISGKVIDVLDPDPRAISLEDIAHHLSMECRYGGAVKRHYSVAEHSIWVGLMAGVIDPAARIHGLMHDRAEYLIKDVQRPLKKKLLHDNYEKATYLIDRASYKSLRIAEPSEDIVDLVHKADMWAFYIEASVLTNGPVPDEKYRPPAEVTEAVKMEPALHLERHPSEIKAAFIFRFKEWKR